MALSRPHHPPGHHHHHHHRSKPRRTTHQQSGSGAGGQPLAGPLRQLHDEYEEALALGGGSSRDASEEDNDAFSEQSDSASSMRQHSHQQQQQQRYQQPAQQSGRTMSSVAPPSSSSSSLYHVLSASPSSASSSSTSAVLNTLPTTARDRVLMDSRQHQQQLSSQHAPLQARKLSSGSAPAPAPSIGAIASSSSSNAQPPPSSSYTSAAASSRRNNAPSAAPMGVAATLAKASAALSSSSSTDLSTYGGDDEATVDDETDDGRSTSHEATQPTTTHATTSGINRGVAGLRLGSLPPPPARPGISSASTTPIAIPVPGARGAIGPTWMSRQDSDYLGDADDDDDEDGVAVGGPGGFGSEADDEAVKAPRAATSAVTGASAAPPGAAVSASRTKATGHNDDTTDDDVSDGGTASPYDGDVEFAAKTPVTQQITSGHGGASGSGFHAPVAAAATGAPPPQQPSSLMRRDVCDAPLRSYQRAPAPGAAEGTATPRTGDAAGFGLSPSLASVSASAPSSTQNETEPSGSSLRASILSLNEHSGVLDRLRGLISSPGAQIRIYVGAPDVDLFARIDGLAQGTAMLRVAKVGVAAVAAGDGGAIDVQVIAGISCDGSGAASGGSSLRLPASQRAALARGCRWVDEVFEGVPREAAAGQEGTIMRRILLEQVATAQAGSEGATLMARFVDADVAAASVQEEWEIRLPMPRGA